MTLSVLTFPGGAWWWAAALAAAVLLPLTWLALQPVGRRSGAIAVGLGLRALGVALLLLCLLDPQWIGRRPRPGANVVAVVADNSQGLQVSDAGAAQSRGAELKGLLEAGERSWLPGLAETYQVRSYVFDRELKRVRAFTDLDFSGDRTSLGRSLQQLRERFAGQPLAAVLLLTDGNATDLEAGLPDVAGLPPIYPVVVGRPGAVRDVNVVRADIRQSPFDDAPVSLDVQVSAQQLGGGAVALKVAPLEDSQRDQAAKEQVLPGPQSVTPKGAAAAAARFSWQPKGSGLQFFQVTAEAAEPATEATLRNNHRTVVVDRGRPAYRILYVGGRPGFDYKFMNRALADDPQLQMVGLLRVARREPKFEFKGRSGEATNPLFRGFGRSEDETARYDQPVLVRVNARDETELRSGFPKGAEELFSYDAVVLDDIEASFFTTEQLSLLRRFASERGGGLLMLGGADSLEHGGYENTPLATALPFYLDRKPAALPEGELAWKLTREGWLEPWARIRAVEGDERERLNRLPTMRVVNALPSVKPGATVLATVEDGRGASFPALAAQNFGSGRVAAVAAGDLWRWGTRSPEDQADLARFWRQLARWLVTNVPSRVSLRADMSGDDGRVKLRVTARDAEYRPLEAGAVRVTLRRLGAAPSGVATPPAAGEFSEATVMAEPVPEQPGVFIAAFDARTAGAYVAEATAVDVAGKPVGQAQAGWVSDPAAAEFRSLEPNVNLLEELARRTGGQVLAAADLETLAKRLGGKPAPIEETWSIPLWHQSAVFLAVLACFVAEWLWRRWKGLA